MAKQRRKIVRAGRLWMAVQYTAIRNAPEKQTREPKFIPSDLARKHLNAETSKRKLFIMLHCNFTASDIVATLTYDERTKPNRDQANRNMDNFIRAFRKARRERGQPLKYVRVLQGNNTDVRVHHHLIFNGTGEDYALVRELWSKYGSNVDFKYFGDDGYDRWSEYLTRWPRIYGQGRAGEKTWRASLHMRKPDIVSELVPEGEKLEPPPGSYILDRNERSNSFGSFCYCDALLPNDD